MSDSTMFEPKPDSRRGSSRREVPDMGRLFDRTPPHHIDAERSLIGSILLDPAVLNDVVELIPNGELFYQESHGTIYQTLVETYEAHQTGDLVQLTESLRAKGVFDQVGGAGYLMELAEAVPSAANAVYYAKRIADSARLRKLIDAAGQILYDAYNQGGGGIDAAKSVIDLAEKRIFDIASEDINAEPETLRELLLAEMERIEQADGKAVSGISTGFKDLDEMLSGLQPEEMVILAARPSMGKTAIALNIAEQIAFGGATPWSPRKINNPVAVGVFSLEMARGALVQRLLSARSGVDSNQLRTGRVNDSEWDKLHRASAELAEAPIYIDDTPGMTVLTMRAKARRMKQRHNIGCIVIDYLQLLSSPSSARESRQVEVSEISRSIKALARELRVPVICLAQLNRGAEQREGNRPKMSDLRESGSIEQDADVVMLLHRESYYHRGEPAWDPTSPEFDEDNREKLNLTELIIAKQRNGPTGTVKLTWDAGTVRFKTHDGVHTGGSYGFSKEMEGGSYGFDGPDFDPAPASGPDFSDAPVQRHSFAPGKKSGPEADFRDGSGNDVSFDDEELPPF
ncbi:MAG: replicative DNA helicase [Phycisphaerales bacterium]|nr:replicative DNA helicase [Phycisphaerales bacterium]